VLSDIEHGLTRAITTFLSGVFTELMLRVFFHIVVFDESFISFLIVLFVLASILDLITRMKYWSTAYLLGFVLGNSIIAYISSIIAYNSIDILAFIVIGILIILKRRT